MWSTSDPVSRLGLSIAIVLVAAKVGGDLASRLKQSSVLGELAAGILLGSLPVALLRELRTDAGVDMLARIGVLVLLFEVGLESTLRDVLAVGTASARVAIAGSLGSLLCGWLAARLVMPEAGSLVHLFVAGALTATSIGISARVLKDAGASRTLEARTILGAAVLDDILGLVMLALVSSAALQARTEGVHLVERHLARWSRLPSRSLRPRSPLGVKLPRRGSSGPRHGLRTEGALLAVGLSFCFVLAWASDVMGLAPIIGAFAAGLILEESHSAHFVQRGERSLRERMDPISSWLVPIFFVLMGMRADLRALSDPPTVLLVAALVAAAVVGKLACAAAPRAGRTALTVVPWGCDAPGRGEPGVLRNLGLSLDVGGHPLLDARQYSALVAVVVLTTLLTPLALRWQLHRSPTAAVCADDQR